MATRANNRPTRNKKRIPVSGNRNVMTVTDLDPNYSYRWVNDNSDGRIDRFKLGGWEIVERKDSEVGDSTAGTSKGTTSLISKMVGKDVTAYLMRINMEFYEEDQLAKYAAISESEEDMKRQLNSGENGTYGSFKEDKYRYGDNSYLCYTSRFI